MKTLTYLFFQVFVKPFYKENAGALVFVYTMMFFIVSTMDGAGMFAYHYSLVTSMLTLPSVFALVFFIWLLYARKCATFAANIIRSPQHSFLYILNNIDKRKRFLLFLFVDVLLLLPILSYAVFIVYVGSHQQLYLPAMMVVVYLLLLCLLMTVLHLNVLSHPISGSNLLSIKKIKTDVIRVSSYPFVLLSFVFTENKAIWIGVKIYSCGVLYLIARYNTAAQYDLIMPFLFFNFGVYSNGVLVYLIRQWEDMYLSFYRSLPVPLFKRLLQYWFVYFILLLPELITAFLLVPVHLHYADAVSFSLCAYSLLLLMNSALFLKDFSTKEFVIILLFFFCVQYILLPTAGFIALYLLFFTATVVLFVNQYYRFEPDRQKESV